MPSYLAVNWEFFKAFVFFLGLFDAAVVVLGGLAIAFYLIIDLTLIRRTLLPALLVLVLTDVLGVLILVTTRWLIS